MIEIDVALVPSEARDWQATVCIVVDELRASSTMTTLLDLGCSRLYVTGSVAAARRLAREHDALLAGERRGTPPPGFDFDNSPIALSRGNVRDRSVVLSTTNGTYVLGQLTAVPAALVGCSRNAAAVAAAALDLANGQGLDIGVVCAGRRRRFALDDTVTAGLIVERLVDAAAARGCETSVTDEAAAAVRLRASYPDQLTPLRESASGRLMTRLNVAEDIDFCAEIDTSASVGVLRPGNPLVIERLAADALEAERRVAAGRAAANERGGRARLSTDERLFQGS